MTIPDPLIQFCEWLVKVTWQAAVLVLLVLLIQWVLGRKLTPVWRYNLWLIVLIRLALPVSPQGSWS
jgi:bla regulator protein BlaR1